MVDRGVPKRGIAYGFDWRPPDETDPSVLMSRSMCCCRYRHFSIVICSVVWILWLSNI